jgi:large subunit ribosomal protein L13
MEENTKTQTKKVISVSNGVDLQTHIIDAKGKKLGRVASRAAHLLMEKDMPSFEKHRKLGSKVRIENAGGLVITEKRASEKNRYKRASGYSGNLVIESIGELRARHGIGEVVKRAVKGMIPNNKLRNEMLKRLEVVE